MSEEQKIHFEAGQILHNNPIGLPCPDYVHALIDYIKEHMGTIYWNVNQKLWLGGDLSDLSQKRISELSYDPLPDGIEWRPYYNWGGEPEDPDWDQGEADKPNFSFDGVEVRWYKRYGRSMNVNVDWDPVQWVEWFNKCLEAIDGYYKSSELYQKYHGAVAQKGE